MNERKYDLEDRLIEFGVSIIKIETQIIKNRAGNTLAGQLMRSATSPALNYGEAQAAESRKDFIHKMKIILKELRETLICLKLIKKGSLITREEYIVPIMDECNQLISIFVKSIETAKRKLD